VKIPNAIAEPTLAKIPKAVHSGPSGKKAINPYATTCGNVASAPTHDAATSTLKYFICNDFSFHYESLEEHQERYRCFAPTQ